MSSEESNKMSKETPSQDSPSDKIEWELDDMIRAYKESCCDKWEDFAGG